MVLAYNQLCEYSDTLGTSKIIEEALRISRVNLIESLKYIYQLHKKPDLTPQWYSIDLTALKQLSVKDTFSEEGRLMDKIKEITTDIDVYMTAIETKRKEVQ